MSTGCVERLCHQRASFFYIFLALVVCIRASRLAGFRSRDYLSFSLVDLERFPVNTVKIFQFIFKQSRIENARVSRNWFVSAYVGNHLLQEDQGGGGSGV